MKETAAIVVFLVGSLWLLRQGPQPPIRFLGLLLAAVYLFAAPLS